MVDDEVSIITYSKITFKTLKKRTLLLGDQE